MEIKIEQTREINKNLECCCRNQCPAAVSAVSADLKECVRLCSRHWFYALTAIQVVAINLFCIES